MGRPTLYSEKLAAAICERLACGEPLAKICRDDAMPSYSTVNKWIAEKPEFSEHSARAKQHGTHYLADESIEIADEPLPDDPEAARVDVAHRKLKIDTRIRLIGKWNQRDYGDKTTVAGDPDAPLIPPGFILKGIPGAEE